MNNWLRANDVLLLEGDPECDPCELSRLLEPLRLKAFTTTRSALAEDEVKRLLLEKGISYLWQRVDLEEALLPRGLDLPALLVVLRGMLKRFMPVEELIIVDPYLLPERSPNAVESVISLLEPVASDLARLLVVTSERHDRRQLATLRSSLGAQGQGCEFRVSVSEHFHDRFWIADRHKGLFVGTSPNGLGKRYALADYIQPSDVVEIVDALRREGLL